MDHRIKLYIEKTGILLAVYLLLKYLLPLVFPFFLAWLTVSLLASASRHFHRKLLPFTASVVAMFFFFTAATLKLTGWLLLKPCKSGNFFRCGRTSFYVCRFCLTGFLPPCLFICPPPYRLCYPVHLASFYILWL